MKISFNDREIKQKDITINRPLTIHLNNDVDINITIDQFGNLVIEKENYGQGESSIIIKPSVSNVIRIS